MALYSPPHQVLSRGYRTYSCVLLCLRTRFPPTHRSSLYRSSLVGTVICARQLFGDNTVLPHYESHTVNLTRSVD